MKLMKFTRIFRELNKGDANIAGGKGASLGEMTQAGIPVPPGFVVLSTTFDEFIKYADLVQEIEAVLDTVDHKKTHTVESASEKIQSLIKNAVMPENIANEILNEFKVLGAQFVAVRSSATAEDGQDHAWAGQLDSYLNTREDYLLEKVKHCWASLFTPRAVFYRFEKGLHTTQISVAVVVQKMVQSEVSGIAFSVHPVKEDYNQLIIEAGYGLGEAIVSGSITPDSYVVEKDPRSIIDVNIADQKRAIVNSDTGNEWVVVENEKRELQKLSSEQILVLSQIIMNIENHYGFPCDIEWAYERGKFYIVQSRPITTLRKNAPSQDNGIAKKPWKKLAMRTQDVLHWDININVRREKIWVGPVFFTSSNDLIIKNGNMLASFYAKNPPIDERTNIREFCITQSTQLDNALEEAVNLIDKSLRLVPGTTKKDFQMLHKHLRQNISLMLFGLICNIVPVEILKNSMGDNFTKLEEVLLLPHRATILTREAKEISSIQKQLLDHDKDWLQEKAQFLADHFGFIHSEYISKPWNAILYVEAIKGVVVEVREHREFDKTQFSQYELWLIDIIQKLSYLHDEGKTAVVRANWALRETAKALGVGDTILRLTESELNNWIESGDLPDTSELKVRESHYVIISNGAEHFFKSGEQEVKKVIEQEGIQEYVGEAEHSDLLKGKIASSGFARGRVRLVFTQEDSRKLVEGEILVSGMTTPAYIDAMRKAAAYVTDEGGVICHAAIVAREFGKPCVVGAKIATQVLKDGDMIEVDADNGVVRVVK